ncbi:MAG: hypothetical protein V1727_01350 [Candidatus Omnitrophota bacterium]|jgi:YbbR domain-containing protein
MKSWVTHNFWLKFISLILAIVTWYYISVELANSTQEFNPQRDFPRAPVMPKP